MSPPDTPADLPERSSPTMPAPAGGTSSRPAGWARWMSVGYLGLLLLSHLTQALRAVPETRPGLHEAALAAGSRAGRRETVVARWEERGSPDRPAAVVISHHEDLIRVVLDHLPEGIRVLAPELPMRSEAGPSAGRTPLPAQAADLGRLLDHLEIERAHLLGHRLGGGVALHLASARPGQIASLTLLSSIGTEEFELFGDHYLNRVWHGLHRIGAWILRNGLPHFGMLRPPALDPVVLRSVYEADLRPLRRRLKEYEGPALMLHAPDDLRVPRTAALESLRLLPQAEWADVEDAARPVLVEPAQVGLDLWLDFVSRAERGEARRRADADPARAARAAEPFRAGDGVRLEGISRVLFAVLLFVLGFVSEDLTSVAAGLMVARGSVGFLFAVATSAAALYLGTCLFYWQGRWMGVGVLRWPLVRWMAPEHEVLRSQARFQRHGHWVILASRFIPGIRFPVYITSGILRIPFLRFSVCYLAGLALWGTALVALGARFGPGVIEFLSAYGRWTVQGLIALLVILGLGKHLLVPSLSWRGRRLLIGRWQRVLRWEFWSPWLFHAPLIPLLVRLAWRYRGVTVFTAAHPGWASRRPDAAASMGMEFGLVFARRPGEAEGRVVSVIRRVDGWVTGDGVSTLERLILAHPDGVAAAPELMRQFATRLYDVPLAGQRIRLAGPGRPGQGTRFQDAGGLRTPALVEAVRRFVASRPGLDLARLVVRCDSEREVREGRFEVASVQGLSGLLTRTWLPEGNWAAALGRLASHWRLAYEIGAGHRDQGIRVVPIRVLLGRLLAARRARLRLRDLPLIRPAPHA